MAATHLKEHSLISIDDHVLTGEANPTGMAANQVPATNGTNTGLIAKSFGTAATGNNLVERQANGHITLPAGDPVVATDATSKAYVDSKVVTGVTWKELVLVQQQLLNGASGGILQGILAAIATNPTNGDTFVITDGTTTETFTFLTSPVGAFDVQIGGDAATTSANLVSQINTDSTLWSSIGTTGLDPYFTGANDPQFVVYRTAISSAADRVYGTLTATNGIQVVEFATGTQDYRESSGTQSDLPASDPGAKRFGFGRAQASVQVGDTHRVAEDNTAFTWDGDDTLWQNTDSGGTVTAGDGIDVTGGKVSANTATAAGAQQFGGLVKNRTSDGSATAAADQGYLAVQTDNVDLEVNASNQVAIKSGSRLDTFQGFGSWASGAAADKSPDLTELNTFFGVGATGQGQWGYLVEDGTSVGSTSTFLVYKKGAANALTDYQMVELA